jgi:hypothetical protein
MTFYVESMPYEAERLLENGVFGEPPSSSFNSRPRNS